MSLAFAANGRLENVNNLAELHARIVDSMKFHLNDHAAQMTNNVRNIFTAFSEHEMQKKIIKLEQKNLLLSKQVIKLQHENEQLRKELKENTATNEENKKRERPNNFDHDTWNHIEGGFVSDQAWIQGICCHCGVSINHHRKAKRVRNHLATCKEYQQLVASDAAIESTTV